MFGSRKKREVAHARASVRELTSALAQHRPAVLPPAPAPSAPQPPRREREREQPQAVIPRPRLER